MKSTIKSTLNQSFAEVVKTVSQLRDPKIGCPWDKKQTHNSLITHLLEETYEVANAIRQNDNENLCEELGDLLFQILLHANIASECNHFTLQEIIIKLNEKLIRRHPHVFSKTSTISEIQ